MIILQIAWIIGQCEEWVNFLVGVGGKIGWTSSVNGQGKTSAARGMLIALNEYGSTHFVNATHAHAKP